MSRVLAFEVPPGQPVLRGHDHYWRVILDLDRRGTPWSVTDILARSAGADRSTVRDFVKRLCAGGFAEFVESLHSPPCYRLLRSQLDTPRLRRDGTLGLQGRGQAAMWNVMRGPVGRSGFTAWQLALNASTKTVSVKVVSAASYIKHLARAGYLVSVSEGRRGRPGVWRLKPAHADGCPLPPMILRGDIVYDPNRGVAVGPVEAREVEP